VCAMADPPHQRLLRRTSRRGQNPDRWSWEIHRKSKPLGIKMTGDGLQSEMAAQFAGKQALAEFLAELSKEEKLPRK
jgi:flavin reductase (DIM6/NTAB) family NADH-FMN oxidoreductase RutF